MHTERRRMVRRAFFGGMVLAALAALPLWAWEALYVLLVRRPGWGSGTEAAAFALHLFFMLVLYAALAGAVEGLALLGVSQLTALLAKKRVHEPRWMARILSLLALPAIAVLAAKTFAGRRAQQIPYHDLIAVGLGLIGLLAAYGTFRLIIGCRDRFRLRRWGPRQAYAFCAGLLALSLLLYLADQRILPRLYGFFHVTLALGSVAAAQLAAAAIYAGLRPKKRWMGRLAEPGVALLVLVATVAVGTWSYGRLARSETLLYVAHEHTTLQAKLLQATAALGIGPAPGSVEPAVADAPPPAPLPQVSGPRRPGANVLLITVDALRADHLGAYGYKRPTSPHIDRLARKGVVFSHPYTQVPHTSFSVASLMTGSYLYSLARQGAQRDQRTLPQVLRRYGYKTAAFFPPAVFYIDRQAFGELESSRFGFEYVKYEHLDAKKRVDQVVRFLALKKTRQRDKVFVWVHFFEPHEPYVRHPEVADFGPRAVDRYDSEIAFVDRQVGRLVREMRIRRPNTVVALTADHGEEFGEHGGHYHGNALYDEQVRVPLVITVPGLPPRRVDGPVQVIDLPATLLSLLDVPLPAQAGGTDLGPWLQGEPAATLPPVFSEIEAKRMVVQGQDKLLCDATRGYCELYDLEADPAERRNLAGKRPERVRALRAQLQRWTASHGTRRGRDEGEAEAEDDAWALLERGRQRDASAVPGLQKLLGKGEPELRRLAARVLSGMREPSARGALVKARKQSDPGVSIAATVGAALQGDAASLDALGPILRRPDLPPELRLDALLALARGGRKAAALPLARLLDRTEDVYRRVRIIEALGHLGDPAAGPALRRQLDTLRTRLVAIQALGRVGDRRTLPLLVRGLREDRFISWRRAEAQALGLLGSRRALPALQQAVRRDLEYEVVRDALVSLAMLGGLPAPGLRPLDLTGWRCEGQSCTLPLQVECPGPGGPAQDLLLLLGDKAPSWQDLPAGKGEAEEPGEQTVTRLTVRCGETIVATVEHRAQKAPGAALPLPPEASGPLTLTAAAPPPPLYHLALRPTPSRPVD